MPTEKLEVRLRGSSNDVKFDQPLPINAPEPVAVNSKLFRGQLLFLHALAEGNGPHTDHFAHRKRRLEIRLQGVFTENPDDVYLAVELSQVVRPGMLSAYAVKCVLAFVSAINKMKDTGFSYNIDPIERSDGDCEGQHFVWPIKSADTVVATPLGEPPPNLMEFVEDTPPHEKRGLKLDQDHVWTFVWHTMYVDLVSWEVCNILGFSQALDGFIGHQELIFSYYKLKDGVNGYSPEAGRDCDSGLLAHGDRNRQIFMQLIVVPERAGQEQLTTSAMNILAAEQQTKRELEVQHPTGEEADEASYWVTISALVFGGSSCCASRQPIRQDAPQTTGEPPSHVEVAAQQWEQLLSQEASKGNASKSEPVESSSAEKGDNATSSPPKSNPPRRFASWLSKSGPSGSCSSRARSSKEESK